jgi:hypothetical protein
MADRHSGPTAKLTGQTTVSRSPKWALAWRDQRLKGYSWTQWKPRLTSRKVLRSTS